MLRRPRRPTCTPEAHPPTQEEPVQAPARTPGSPPAHAACCPGNPTLAATSPPLPACLLAYRTSARAFSRSRCSRCSSTSWSPPTSSSCATAAACPRCALSWPLFALGICMLGCLEKRLVGLQHVAHHGVHHARPQPPVQGAHFDWHMFCFAWRLGATLLPFTFPPTNVRCARF